MNNLTPEQLDTLRHMLGINTPDDKRPKPYRDYYCASKGDAKLAEMARIGAVELYRIDESYEWYCCSPKGREVAMASHKTIRRSKGSRMYSKYLDVHECCPDMTFKDFLTKPEFAESRASA